LPGNVRIAPRHEKEHVCQYFPGFVCSAMRFGA
jgi:hypothetical protein